MGSLKPSVDEPQASPQPPPSGTRSPAHRSIRLAIQLALAVVLGLFAPFVVLACLGANGLDIAAETFGILLAVYALTFLLIGAEGIAALRSGAEAIDPSDLSLRPRWAQRLAWEMELLVNPPDGLRGIERFNLLVWRPAYLWLSWLPIPLIGYWVWRHDVRHYHGWLILIGILIAVWVLHSAPIQTLFTYLLARRSRRTGGGTLTVHLLGSMLFHAGLRNMVARIAQVKIMMGEMPRVEAAASVFPDHVAGAVELSPAPVSLAAPDHVRSTPPLMSAPVPAEVGVTSLSSFEPQSTTRPIRAPAVTQRAAPEDARRVAVELGDLVETLVRRRDEGSLESVRLAETIHALEMRLDTLRSLTLQMQAASDRSIAPQSLSEVEATLRTLMRDPSDLQALTSIGQQAGTLAQVVERYVAIQRALGGL